MSIQKCKYQKFQIKFYKAYKEKNNTYKTKRYFSRCYSFPKFTLVSDVFGFDKFGIDGVCNGRNNVLLDLSIILEFIGIEDPISRIIDKDAKKSSIIISINSSKEKKQILKKIKSFLKKDCSLPYCVNTGYICQNYTKQLVPVEAVYKALKGRSNLFKNEHDDFDKHYAFIKTYCSVPQWNSNSRHMNFDNAAITTDLILNYNLHFYKAYNNHSKPDFNRDQLLQIVKHPNFIKNSDLDHLNGMEEAEINILMLFRHCSELIDNKILDALLEQEYFISYAKQLNKQHNLSKYCNNNPALELFVEFL